MFVLVDMKREAILAATSDRMTKCTLTLFQPSYKRNAALTGFVLYEHSGNGFNETII